MDTILSSTTRLVANRAAWEDEWKRRKIEDLAVLLQGALEARQKVGLKMNLRKDCLDRVRQLLLACKGHSSLSTHRVVQHRRMCESGHAFL